MCKAGTWSSANSSTYSLAPQFPSQCQHKRKESYWRSLRQQNVEIKKEEQQDVEIKKEELSVHVKAIFEHIIGSS